MLLKCVCYLLVIRSTMFDNIIIPKSSERDSNPDLLSPPLLSPLSPFFLLSLSLSLFSCALFFIAFCVCRKRFVFLNCYIFCKLMNNNILVVKINSINKI
uniref:Uncharacterized protein n=1 Tax=Cacopsylla melanoneura TaxID=428564 RepID=A0A8D8LDR0_9HEMI